MKLYTVKQIAEILDTNPETVRRWIRDGRLTAIQSSRKSGNVISEDAFNQFLKETPKYASIAVVVLSMATLGIFPIFGSLIGLIGTKINAHCFGNHNSNVNLSREELEEYLAEIIMDSKNKIQRNKQKIAKLQMEIRDEEKNIQEINALRDNIQAGTNRLRPVSLPENETEDDKATSNE